MRTYLNVEGVCGALGISRKTFYLKHRKRLEHPKVLPGRRGLWWSKRMVEQYKKRIAAAV